MIEAFSVRRIQRMVERILVVAAFLFVGWFFYWTIAANGGFEDSGDFDYYRLLVRGWRKGQLALDKEPSPALLALADPYDPAQNGPHRLGDASYYKGKYYLYFGAAPALTLMLPVSVATGREMTTGAATFVFCTLAFSAAAGLWLAIRRRYFPESAAIVAPLGVLALGFGTHLLALAQRAAFWELPIAAGLAFTLLALIGVYRAIHGRRPLLAMAGAGLALGLAVASRPTWLFAAPLFLAPIIYAWQARSTARLPAWWKWALAAMLPLGACGLAMMAHNFARFGNALEFGQHYQLSGAYEGKLVHFSPRFIAHNFAVYFFQPLKWSWAFPFVTAQAIPVSIPGYFGTEEVSGVAVTFLFVWFVLGLPLIWHGRNADDTRTLVATTAGIAGALVPVAALLLSYFSTTSRYQPDFALLFGLFALGGLLGIERAAQRVRWGRVTVIALALVTCAVTVVVGTLASFDYHGRSVGRANPKVWARWEQNTEGALGELGRRLGQFDGPRVLKARFRARPVGTVETFWRATDARAEESIRVEHIGDRLIRFGYARGTAPVQWGRPLQWETDHTHTVEVQLPSMYGPPRGWMRELRRSVEFRERSSAAVWFSGGRALGLVVEPLAQGIVAGGAVGTDFSGEIRANRGRLFREEDVRDPGLFPAGGLLGGTLRLRVVLADQLLPAGEPLFTAGAHYASDMIFARPVAGGFKLVFDHYGTPAVESAVLPLTRSERMIEIVLPSCRRGAEEFGAFATGDVVVRVDGVEVIRTQQSCFGFAPGSEEVGRNPFDTTCGPRFRGWIHEARWVD